MTPIYPRERYLSKVRPHINKPLIKVITGIRRSGKSALLSLIEDELRNRGVASDHILRINFEDTAAEPLTDRHRLSSYLEERMTGSPPYYILLDEIQEVGEWERLVNSLLAGGNTDIYLTGSNSRLLSSELSTYLAGRYIEITVQTLSFSEYLEFTKEITGTCPENRQESFMHYLRLGGFPLIHTAQYDETSANIVVGALYSSVVLRDVIQRHNIRSTDLLERLIRYLFDNVGRIFSAKNISDFLKSENRTFSTNTIYEYLGYLEEAFVIHRTPRYDLSGKRILKTLEKYYVSDISLVNATLGYRETAIAGLLENVIFLELLSRDYRVCIGKQGEREIDFIAEKQGEKLYVQVCRTLAGSPETLRREITPLLAAKDQYPKYIVTMDEPWAANQDGVQILSMAEFLLREHW